MLLTSFIDAHGKIIFDSRYIALHYMGQTRFYLDVFSLLGAGIFVRIHRYFKLFGLFKLLRVLRMGNMISEMNSDEVTKALLNLAKLMLYLFLYLHALACYCWLSISENAPVQYYLDKESYTYLREFKKGELS